MKDNILIAKFMGWNWSKEGNGKTYLMNPRLQPEEIIYSTRPEQLVFHKSWDRLMPVIEKIEKLGVTTQICYAAGSKTYCTWILGLYNDYDSTNVFPSKIESVYSAVVEFIKWYNKQNKK
jgi:hypothetical protein